MDGIEKNKGLIKKSERGFRVLKPAQTGFSSPATHYAEPRIDLNEVLVKNPDSTFFIRVVDESYAEFGIAEKDVLIIDKSIQPKPTQLVCVTKEGVFEIERMDFDSKEETQLWGTITHIIKSVL
ncbi:MAG: DNA polymerase V [Urechidicola sp.]|mgnify:FL=1|jgi:DNA polymerase V|tara:strand:- start:4748 stop:5119 length:372 start_codon:yes stop_codon:yes gene_type:complete